MYNDTAFTKPADILALPWEKNPPKLLNRNGVYLIRMKSSGALLYVGQSGNLAHRLFPSVHPVYKPELHDLFVVFTTDRKERLYLEERCIELLNPPANRRMGFRTELTDEARREYYRIIFD